MPKISVEFDGSVDMTDPENPKVTPTSISRPIALLVRGVNAGGACSMPGVKVGDTVSIVRVASSGQDVSFRFENVITVDDEIQQLPGTPNYSSAGLFAVVNPAA